MLCRHLLGLCAPPSQALLPRSAAGDGKEGEAREEEEQEEKEEGQQQGRQEQREETGGGGSGGGSESNSSRACTLESRVYIWGRLAV